jgi:ArsR family transcriptional regulator
LTNITSIDRRQVCEPVPLFDLSQPTASHHLKVLREAGIVGSERRRLWAATT